MAQNKNLSVEDLLKDIYLNSKTAAFGTHAQILEVVKQKKLPISSQQITDFLASTPSWNRFHFKRLKKSDRSKVIASGPNQVNFIALSKHHI